MAEHIDRELVIKAIRNEDKDVMADYGEEYGTKWGFSEEKIIEIIMKVSAADVASVVHGEWEPGNPICPVCGESKFKDLDADVWADWQPKFCPNCGAKMDAK